LSAHKPSNYVTAKDESTYAVPSIIFYYTSILLSSSASAKLKSLDSSQLAQ